MENFPEPAGARCCAKAMPGPPGRAFPLSGKVATEALAAKKIFGLRGKGLTVGTFEHYSSQTRAIKL
jgi:hypothetical protein